MKSVSWMEFLITFGIFLGVIIFLFYYIQNFRVNYIKNFYNVYFFQEGFLISFSLYNYNLSNLNNFILNNRYYSQFYIKNIPLFIYLPYNDNYSCNINSVCLYYNSSGYFEIYQLANSNATESQISLSVFQSGNDLLYNITNGNVTFLCLPLYQNSYIYLKGAYNCIINIYGNSSLMLYPVDNNVALLSYKSILKLYNNNNEIFNPLSELFSAYYTYYSFIYKNGTLFYDLIEIE